MTSADKIHETARPQDLADQAAESIRALNHLTPGGLDYPGDLYEVVASLKLLTQRLPQLFDQLSAWLELEYTAGRIAHDSGQIPEPWVHEITCSLGHAGAGAAGLADVLNAAHNACSGLKAADSHAGEITGTEAGS